MNLQIRGSTVLVLVELLLLTCQGRETNVVQGRVRNQQQTLGKDRTKNQNNVLHHEALARQNKLPQMLQTPINPYHIIGNYVQLTPRTDHAHEVQLIPRPYHAHEVQLIPRTGHVHEVQHMPKTDHAHAVHIPPSTDHGHRVQISPKTDYAHEVQITPKTDHKTQIPPRTYHANEVQMAPRTDNANKLLDHTKVYALYHPQQKTGQEYHQISEGSKSDGVARSRSGNEADMKQNPTPSSLHLHPARPQTKHHLTDSRQTIQDKVLMRRGNQSIHRSYYDHISYNTTVRIRRSERVSCVGRQVIRRGVCSCPHLSRWDEASNDCECIYGTYRDPQGMCQAYSIG